MRRQLTVLPDFHFLLVAPNLDAAWLFDAARNYWDRFRPTIIGETRFLELIPASRFIAVTVIARRDIIDQLGVQVAQAALNAYFDPVVAETVDEMRVLLDERAASNQPFGVALATPFPTVDINARTPAAIPTANLPTTRPPVGFITATPAAQTTQDAPAPIDATPGPITGGG
jgi:hypothetical protein